MADDFGFGSWLSDWSGGFGGGLAEPSYSLPSGGLDTGWLSSFETPTIPGAGSGGGGDFWSSFGGGLNAVGNIAKSAAPILGLGTTALGAIGGIQQMRQGAQQMDVLRQQQRQQQAMAAPAAAAGGALTQAGQAALLGGALPPALEAQVEDFKNRARMQYQQMLASQGMSDSSAALQMDAWVETQAQKLRGELAGGLYGQGLQGIGTAMGPSATVSQTALGMAGGTTGSIEAANRALADLLGGQ